MFNPDLQRVYKPKGLMVSWLLGAWLWSTGLVRRPGSAVTHVLLCEAAALSHTAASLLPVSHRSSLLSLTSLCCSSVWLLSHKPRAPISLMLLILSLFISFFISCSLSLTILLSSDWPSDCSLMFLIHPDNTKILWILTEVYFQFQQTWHAITAWASNICMLSSSSTAQQDPYKHSQAQWVQQESSAPIIHFGWGGFSHCPALQKEEWSHTGAAQR